MKGFGVFLSSFRYSSAFPIQKPFLCLYAPCESRQRTVGSDDTVAGDEDADAVGADGLRHSPYALDVVHPMGYLLVTSRFSVGDFL